MNIDIQVPSMDMWYEDGLGGSFQGTLTLGKESTTNTYEGHVFFFTGMFVNIYYMMYVFFLFIYPIQHTSISFLSKSFIYII